MNDLINKIKVLRDVNINNNVMHRHKNSWWKMIYKICVFNCIIYLQ